MLPNRKPVCTENHVHKQMGPIYLVRVRPVSQILPELLFLTCRKRVKEEALVFKGLYKMRSVWFAGAHDPPTKRCQQSTGVKQVCFHDFKTYESVGGQKPAETKFFAAVASGISGVLWDDWLFDVFETIL